MRFRRFVRATWIFYPLIIGAAMYFLLPMFPEFTEYAVSRGLGKIVSVPLGFVTSLIPVSVTELLAVLALPLVIFALVMFIIRVKHSGEKRRTVLRGARCVCGFLSFAVLLYMIDHGANYYRVSVGELMGLDTSPKTAEHLFAVCCELADNARETRGLLEEDENGCMVFSENVWTELTRAGSGYRGLERQYPFLVTGTWRQKPVLLSYYWSYTHIVGMYFPFFAECNVNIEQPDFGIPFTASHESAHSRGIALEDECNFLAFLSCIDSEYPEYRYSGYLNAFKYCANALYAYDRELWAAAWEHCSEGMRRDLTAENEFIDRFTNKVTEVSANVNDTFIKSQGVADGRLSYDRVTALILAYYEKMWSEGQ